MRILLVSFCYLQSFSIIDSVLGERVLVVSEVFVVHDDDIFCGGLHFGGFIIVFLLCVEVLFPCVFLGAVGAHDAKSSAGLVNQNMATNMWRSFWCVLFLQVSSGISRILLVRFVVHLPMCLGWCILIPLAGLSVVVWSWLVRQLASDSGDDEETAVCRWPMPSTNQQHVFDVLLMGSVNFEDSSSI